MTTKRAIELLEIEKECVQRANTCGRDCAHCKLVQNDEELIEMYEFVIGFIKSKSCHAAGDFIDYISIANTFHQMQKDI